MDQAQAQIINNALPDNQRVGLGSELLKMQTKYPGKEFFIDPVHGLDSNSGTAPDKAFLTLSAGYAALTDSSNDRLFIIGGATNVNVTAAFTWAKSYTHLIGVAQGGAYGRVKICPNADFTPVFTISADGCIFENLNFQFGNGNAGNLVGLYLYGTSQTGSKNTFNNCHFNGPLTSSEGGAAFKCVTLGIGSQYNQFNHCTFGKFETPMTINTAGLLAFLGDNGGTKFDNCDFICCGTVDMTYIKAAVNLGGEYSYVIFDKCKFLTISGVSNTVLLTAPTDGRMFFLNCKEFGFANYSATSSRVILANGTAIDARYGGLGVVEA